MCSQKYFGPGFYCLMEEVLVVAVTQKRWDTHGCPEWLVTWADGIQTWEPKSSLVDEEYVNEYWEAFEGLVVALDISSQ